MADKRLKDNAPLTSLVGNDLIFTANSASTPADIESKTTFDEFCASITTLQGGVNIAGSGALTTENNVTLDDGTGTSILQTLEVAAATISPSANTFGNTLESTGTISQSGHTITGVGTAFTSAMVGGLLKWVTGGLQNTYALITGYTSATSITVDTAATQAGNQSFFIFYGGLSANNGNSVGFSSCNVYGLPTSTQTLIDGATISMNYQAGGIGVVTLGGARNINVPTNITTGCKFTLVVTSQGFQPVWNTNYAFPNGTPYSNSVSGAIDFYDFEATSTTTACLIGYRSSVPNWDNFDGSKKLGPFAFSAKTTAESSTAQSTAIRAIPSTSNYLAVIQANGGNSIYAFVFQFDNNGVPVVPDFSTWTTIAASGVGAITTLASIASISIAMLTDGLNAIVSFGATVSGVQCQNLIPVSISGSTVTAGNLIQVRGSETISNIGSVRELDTSNFGLVFRANASSILYAYPCSLAYPTITVGSSPLTIETGNGGSFDGAQETVDSTHTMLLWMSTLTATPTYVYASRITWNGTGSTPSISTIATQLSTSGTSSSSKTLRIISKNGDSTKFLCAFISGAAITVQVVTNASPPVASGSPYTTETDINAAGGIYLRMPDTKHIWIGGSSNINWMTPLWLLNLDSSNNITLNKKYLMPFSYSTSQTFSETINSGQVCLGYVDNQSSSAVKMLVLKP